MNRCVSQSRPKLDAYGKLYRLFVILTQFFVQLPGHEYIKVK